jgi:uncharacterized protein YfaS (alpha-2-macroglobulin family)
MYGSAVALILLVVATTSAWAVQPRFYLSTERVFAPGDKEAKVRLEARGVPHVDFRLYRIPYPEEFFQGQADLHRVELPNVPKRVSCMDVLNEALRASQENILALVRGRFADDARSAGRRAYPEDVGSIQSGAEHVSPPTTVVPLIKGYLLVDLWRENLPSNSPEWAYLDVAVTAREPGVYLLEGVYGHEVGYTVVIISKIVLLTRQSPDRFLVYAVDADLGTPAAGVSITLRRGDQVLGQGRTDEQGLWSKEIPLVRDLVVFASRDKNFALSAPSYHPANLFRRKVYLTTERPVYRPGQEVFFKGIIRGYRDEQYRIEPEIKAVEVRAVDPNGQEVFSASISVKAGGSFDGKFKLFDHPSMGSYRLLANVSGNEYAGEFKVKAYRKPEYQVNVSIGQRAAIGGEEVRAGVRANYYFGPPVQAAKVKVSVYRTRFHVPWWVDADYSWYYSDAEYQNTRRETILEQEGRLDQDGKFDFSVKTLPDSQDYTYGIEAVVIDAGGRAVSGYGSVRVTRAKFRVALRPEHLIFSPGGEVRVQVETVDFARKPVAADVQVTVEARLGKDPASMVTEEILKKTVSTGAQGRAVISFEPSRGGTYKVIARAQDDAGSEVAAQTLVYVTRRGGDIPYAPEELQIVADRRSYQAGDRARFLLLVPHPGTHLLVTVEGGRLYRHEVLQAHGYSAIFELPIQEAQTPNFFIRVATVFDRTLYERRLDVVVPPKEKLLDVEVAADRREARPGDQVSFTVSVRDHRGNPVSGAEVALSVVDAAVYGISPEIAIPISRFFFHRKRNNVRGTCSLDFRFYGYGQDQKDRMAAFLLRAPVVPGSFKALALTEVRRKFKDTLAFFPSLVTDSDGKATAVVTAADNLTSWRGTARVITRDTRVGQATGKFTVSKPVVLRLAAPATLVEKDRTSVGLLVHNYTKQKHSFQVTLQTEGDGIQIEGKPGSIEVAPGKVGVAAFVLTARKAGTAVLKAAAFAQNLSDALEREIPVRPYGMEQVLLAGGVLDDERPEARIALTVPQSAAPKSPRARVTLSTGIAPVLLASLEYLAGYPYGCTEQTMSRFLPDLVVARVLSDLGMQNRKLEETLPEYIHAGLARLSQLQHQDGGWGWWQGDATDPFMTAYVVCGLAMAKRLGWKVNAEMLSRGANRLKSLVKRRDLNANQRAYLLYSLALSGIKYQSMLTKLGDQNLSEYGRALMAMALFELGQRKQAAKLAAQIDLAVHTGPSGAHWGSRNGSLGWERDPVETTAMVLRTLMATNQKSVNIPAAVRWLLAVREGDHWHSTRDTAMVVYALVDYLKKQGSVDYQAEVTASLNDRALPARSFSGQDVFNPSVLLVRDRPARIGENQIQLSRKGRGSLFYNASVKYFGREEKIPARGRKFQITRRMFAIEKKLEGDRWRIRKQPLAGKVRSGDEILVVLELEAAQDADYIIVEDPMPAGTQPIEQDRGYAVPGVRLQQPRLHREFRDSHVAFFISHLRRGKRTLAYLIRATLPGSYNIMPVRILPMYDPHFAGNSQNAVLNVEE